MKQPANPSTGPEAGRRDMRTLAGALLEPTGSRRRNRAAWVLLALAVVIYATTVLVMTRDSIPQIDGLDWFVDALDGFGPGVLATPHNGHPLIPTRFLYTATLHLFGPEQVVIQLFTILAVAASALVLFLLLKKRVDSILALAPAVLVLFLGTTTTPIDPNIAAFAQSIALGLGAFLALERRDRLGDRLAFALLLVGVLTFSVGLTFAVGAGVLVAASPDWRRRAWIVVVPLVVFAIWFVWARKFDAGVGTTSIANLRLAPSYAADSLAAGFSALTGLDREYVSPDGYGLIDLGWGRLFAVAFAGLAVWAAAVGRFSVRAYACVAVLVAYWTLGALAQGADRYPQSVRYVFFTAVLCIVIGYELLRNVPITRRVSIALLALLAFSLPTNVDRMRYTGAVLRQVSGDEAAEFTAIELQRDRVEPGLRTSFDGVVQVPAVDYLELSDRFGSLATPPEELPLELGSARERADATLGAILAPQAVPTASPPLGDCRTIEQQGGEPLEVELPSGGALLRADQASSLQLRRFADAATVDAGALTPGGFAELELPADASTQPWLAVIEGAAEVRACER